MNVPVLKALERHGYARRTIPAVQAEILKAQSPEACYRFANQFLHKPWPEAEQVIAREGVPAFNYAKHVLDGPFPLGERAISMANSNIAYLYAKFCLKGRFLEGEPIIMTDGVNRIGYVVDFLHLELEDLMPYLIGCKYAWRDPVVRDMSDEGVQQKEAYEQTIRKYGEGIYAPKPEWAWGISK
jgi:hypothetical protein